MQDDIAAIAAKLTEARLASGYSQAAYWAVEHGPALIARIEALEAERDRLREALRAVLQYEGHHVYCGHGRDMNKPCKCGMMDAHDKARTALGEQS